MARIRTIKPEFFDHVGLFDLEIESGLPVRLSYIGLWTQCDREGRFEWSARRLKTRILPYDDVDFSRVLDALATRGFIKKYCVNDVFYGVVPSFPVHQVINNRESKSIIPQPIDFNEELDASSTREPRDDHADTGEGKGKERKEYRKQDYIFCGKVIKLNKNDYDSWKKSYHAIPDYDAQLKSADDWINGQSDDKKKQWFHIISASLANKHQKYLKDGKTSDEDWLV